MPTCEPLYVKCNKSFSLILAISEYEKKDVRCPECGGSDVRQQTTSFQTETSRES
jgi:ssDNA-binding Zn-finger/Zn-ribbon topoisomerase 1